MKTLPLKDSNLTHCSVNEFCLCRPTVLAAPSDKLDCSKIEEVLDDLGAAQGISVLNDKYKLATNQEELAKRCAEMSEAIKQLKKYNKECYSSLTQQVMSAILRTRSQMNEDACKPERQADAFAATKCIAENAYEKVKAAERSIVLTSQVVLDSNIADEKLRLRRSCCAVQVGKTLFLDAIKEKCSAHEKMYTDYVDSYTSEAMGLICPEPEKLECDKLEALKIEGVQPKSTFFLNPLLKLVKSLDH